MAKKQLLFISLAVLLVISLIILASFASAEFWACFNKGEKIDFCNPKTKDRTAPNDGYQLCMSSYNETKQCYNQGNWMVCNTLEPECSSTGGNTSLDAEAPTLTTRSPEQNGLFTEKSILLDLEMNEEGSIYYRDNLNGNGDWKKLCSDCSDYYRTKSFVEGKNNITFKAVDVVDNEAFVNRSFFIDSKKPKIKKTEPKSRFANGFFEVEIQEENPTSLVLNYGNFINNYQTEDVSLKDCTPIKGNSNKFLCEVDIRDKIKTYEGQQIEYWFVLEDIAGNTDESKHIILDVDTTPPKINSLEYPINGKYVYFSLDITEDNFDEAGYTEIVKGKDKYTKLCSRLKNGLCEARKSFSKGHHVLDIQITDEAGNSIAERIEFDV